MKLIGIAETKDEQDIIEPWVRHNMQLLDDLIVTDGSNDATFDILTKLANEFQNRITLTRQTEFADFQCQRTTVLFQQAAEMGADFVFPLDADEFLGVSSRSQLEPHLLKIPLGGTGNMPWETYVVTPDTLEACAADSPKGFKYRRQIENPLHYKVIVRVEGTDVANSWIGIGNHDCSSPKGISPNIVLDFPLLHFPLRSEQQLLAKTVTRWVSLMGANPDMRANGGGWHARRNFDKLVAEESMDLCSLSRSYAQYENIAIPLIKWIPDIQYERKYSTGKAMNAMALIAKSWENSLK